VEQEMDFERCTLSVCEIARRAGEYIKGERAKFSLESVERKHAHDYVSYVDKGSELLIVSALRELLPEAGFITEEGTADLEGTADFEGAEVRGCGGARNDCSRSNLVPPHPRPQVCCDSVATQSPRKGPTQAHVLLHLIAAKNLAK
jgi:3'-phosphoadenosine 5'-phosphosulfate (PAPS) 3'-phosphatase